MRAVRSVARGLVLPPAQAGTAGRALTRPPVLLPLPAAPAQQLAAQAATTGGRERAGLPRRSRLLDHGTAARSSPGWLARAPAHERGPLGPPAGGVAGPPAL